MLDPYQRALREIDMKGKHCKKENQEAFTRGHLKGQRIKEDENMIGKLKMENMIILLKSNDP